MLDPPQLLHRKRESADLPLHLRLCGTHLGKDEIPLALPLPLRFRQNSTERIGEAVSQRVRHAAAPLRG